MSKSNETWTDIPRFHSCGRKKWYQSEDDALNAAEKLLDINDDTLKTYKCNYGEHWHVGHGRER